LAFAISHHKHRKLQEVRFVGGSTMFRIMVAVAAGLALMAAAGETQGAEPAGDWLGVLSVSPARQLHLAVHIHSAPGGGFAGTLDSLDQGALGIPLSRVTAGPDGLSFQIATVGARYAGQWDPNGARWVGQWTQAGGAPLALTLAAGAAPPAPASPVISGLDGDWDGVLTMGLDVRLRVALHVVTDARGSHATLDSIDQGAMGLPISAITRDGEKTSFEIKTIQGRFEGVLDASSQTLTGQWSQLGRGVALVLTRRPIGQAQAVLNRPQTPVKPYPYREEEVTFDNAAEHVTLAGTLTLPLGEGPFPVVVLVAGSGPNTRDEPILGHRPFLVLADHLTRHGIAVLRYDKRGTGASAGDYAKATTMDFADDVQAAVGWLAVRKDIDPRHIGLIGHSEGGIIAPIVAARDHQVAFVVTMAGSGVDGARVLMAQGRLIMKAAGASQAKIDNADALRARMIAIVRTEKDPAAAATKLRATAAADAKVQGLSDAEIDAQVTQINSDWFRFFFDYDPAPTLRALKCPVLAIVGAKDLQVPPNLNIPAIRAALAHNPDVEIDELPGLNHLFQTAGTGSVREYGQIEETLASSALERVTRWILAHASRPTLG
jgi:pimeloyl-ACP methyl ester carboxylesterase